MPEGVRTRTGTTVAFGEVVRQVKDRVTPEKSGLERYVAGEHMDTDCLRIQRWGEIGNDYLGPAFHMRFKPGHVLYGSRRTYLRKVGLADFEGITANTTYVLESKDRDVLLPELLPFVMQSEKFHEHSIAESKGSVNPYVNFSDLAQYEFHLPPLEEQRRIAEVLQAVESAINGLSLLSSTTLCLRSSQLRELLNYRPGWQKTKLEDVAQVIGGGTPATSKREYWNGDIPWFTPTEIVAASGRVVFDSVRKITKMGLENSSAKILPKGTVMLTTRASIGAAAIAGRAVTTNQGFQSLVPGCKTSSEFLLIWCQNNIRQLLLRASGSTFLEIPSTEVKKLRVDLPSISEQKEILTRVQAIDVAANKLETRRLQLVQIKQGLFRNELNERRS
jgi:type I restriction enzyme S subunit